MFDRFVDPVQICRHTSKDGWVTAWFVPTWKWGHANLDPASVLVSAGKWPAAISLKVQGFRYYYISFYMFCEAKDLQQLVSTRKSDYMPCKSLSRCRDNLRRLFSRYRKYRISVRRIFSHRPEVKRCEHWRTLLNLCQDKKDKEKILTICFLKKTWFVDNKSSRRQIMFMTI